MITQPKLQISEADVAPVNSIISGATELRQSEQLQFVQNRTPVRTPNDSLIAKSIRRNAEVSELDRTVFRSQDICTFNISVYDALIMKVNQTHEHLLCGYRY